MWYFVGKEFQRQKIYFRQKHLFQLIQTWLFLIFNFQLYKRFREKNWCPERAEHKDSFQNQQYVNKIKSLI